MENVVAGRSGPVRFDLLIANGTIFLQDVRYGVGGMLRNEVGFTIKDLDLILEICR